MGRTQIYLTDDELRLLDRESRATGASRSELIRRAIHEAYGKTSKADRLLALRETAGTWVTREETGEEYVDSIRGDMNERLRRLGLE
jgi:hypothetical protein